MSDELRTGRRLRQEASDLEVGQLSKGQRLAIAELLELIEDAVHYSADDFGTKALNRILLLEGDRGSGKSSVIHTLRFWMDPDDRNLRRRHEELQRKGATWSKARGNSTEEAKRAKNIREQLMLDEPETLKNRALASYLDVDWLEPLSLDPLPEGTNLLAAILARVVRLAEHTVRESEIDQRRGLLEDVNALHSALNELNNLRGLAVKSLEGNIKDRGKSIDPDDHASQVNEIEAHKLTLAVKLNRVLGRVLAGSTVDARERDGIVILTIDDVDMQSKRAVEVLRLAYGLDVPRLLFVLVGSASKLTEALEQEFRATGAGDGSVELASSELRKMVPLLHRVRVADMKRNESFDLRLGEGEEKLENILARIAPLVEPVSRGNSRYGDEFDRELTTNASEESPPPLAAPFQLLFGELKAEDSTLHALLRAPIYEARRVLKAPPRNVLEFAEAMRAVRNAEEKHRGDELARRFAAELTALVEEDGGLGPEGRRAFRGCVEWHRTACELTPPAAWSIILDVAESVDVHINSIKAVPVTAHFARLDEYHLEHHRDGAPEETTPKPRLGKRAAPWFELLHDGMRLGLASGRVTREIGTRKLEQLAYTRWNPIVSASFDVSWFSVEWPTFIHLGSFRAAWNAGMGENLRVDHEASKIDDAGHASHAQLAAVQALLGAAQTNISLIKFKGEKEARPTLNNGEVARRRLVRAADASSPWEWDGGAATLLTVAFESVFEEWLKRHLRHQDDLLTSTLKRVLVDVVCLLMPECGPQGLPEAFATFRTSVHEAIAADSSAFKRVFASVSTKLQTTEREEDLRELRTELLQAIKRRRLDRLKETSSVLFAIALLAPELLEEWDPQFDEWVKEQVKSPDAQWRLAVGSALPEVRAAKGAAAYFRSNASKWIVIREIEPDPTELYYWLCAQRPNGLKASPGVQHLAEFVWKRGLPAGSQG